MTKRGSKVLSSVSCYHCAELGNHKWSCPWNTFHTFKKSKYSTSCKECGYIKGNENKHGHSCTGKIIIDSNSETTAHCYECSKRYKVSPVPAYIKAR